jgi:hypothetical protein
VLHWQRCDYCRLPWQEAEGKAIVERIRELLIKEEKEMGKKSWKRQAKTHQADLESLRKENDKLVKAAERSAFKVEPGATLDVHDKVGFLFVETGGTVNFAEGSSVKRVANEKDDIMDSDVPAAVREWMDKAEASEKHAAVVQIQLDSAIAELREKDRGLAEMRDIVAELRRQVAEVNGKVCGDASGPLKAAEERFDRWADSVDKAVKDDGR